MNGKRRAVALALCALMLFVLALSSSTAIVRGNHCCTGEDCPVCECVAHIEQMERLFGFAFIAVILLATATTLFRSVRLRRTLTSLRFFTLVSREIRLNN